MDPVSGPSDPEVYPVTVQHHIKQDEKCKSLITFSFFYFLRDKLFGKKKKSYKKLGSNQANLFKCFFLHRCFSGQVNYIKASVCSLYSSRSFYKTHSAQYCGSIKVLEEKWEYPDTKLLTWKSIT